MAKYPSDKMLREGFLPDSDYGIPEKDKTTAKKLKSMNAVILHAAKDVRDLFEGEVANVDEIMQALKEFQGAVVKVCQKRAGVYQPPKITLRPGEVLVNTAVGPIPAVPAAGVDVETLLNSPAIPPAPTSGEDAPPKE